MIVCIRRYFTNHETYHNTQLDLDKLHVDVYTCMYSAYSFSLAHAKKAMVLLMFMKLLSHTICIMGEKIKHR